jgi:hypothetical protein
VWVFSEEELYDRQVIPRRRQLVRDRVRTQGCIKAELRFYGIHLGEPKGRWTQIYLANLRRVSFGNRWFALLEVRIAIPIRPDTLPPELRGQVY